MNKFAFAFLCFTWLADMAFLVIIAPIGKHSMVFAVLFCLGHFLMVFMVRSFPLGITPKKSFANIFALGIMARLLFLLFPVGNDVFRYVWEGYIQNLGFNPFSFAPDSPALTDIARGDLNSIWQQISHPEFSAAYPPATLLLFRVLAWLNPNPFFFKIVMMVFDIGVMIVLMWMINMRGGSPSTLILYACNPLILVYIAGEGHLDVIMVFFLFLATYLILYKKYSTAGFLTLGLAIVSKYFALIALPFLVNAKNRKKFLTVFIPLLLYVPFMDAGIGIFRSVGVFLTDFHYNDSIAVLIRFLFGDLYLFATVFLLTICLAWVYLFVHNQLRSLNLALGCMLLFLPTLHPWYLVLLAPFLVFFPSRAWIYLQAAVVFTFPVVAIELKTGVFQEIQWLKWVEYIPFYSLLIWGLFQDGYLYRDRFYSKPESVSVVIPTLNEAKSLVRCLESLKHRTALNEVIIADGGSMDGTRNIAEELGALVVESPKGRGLQIEKGIESASGDVIIIMHADCAAKKGVFDKVLEALKSHPHAVGGAVGMQFERNNLKTRFIAFLNNARTVLTGISFGDQAQFFRSEALGAMEGFPSMMLMEDVELSLRLKEIGRMLFLRQGIFVSGRRWQGNRFFGNLVTVFQLFTRYLIERRFLQRDTPKHDYYNIYYSNKN